MKELGLVFIAIYIGVFLVISWEPGLIQVRFRVFFFIKPRPDLDPLRVFLKKTHIRPYSLSSQVKFDPLGSGQAGYLRVGFKLPSLILLYGLMGSTLLPVPYL